MSHWSIVVLIGKLHDDGLAAYYRIDFLFPQWSDFEYCTNIAIVLRLPTLLSVKSIVTRMTSMLSSVVVFYLSISNPVNIIRQ